MSPFEHLAAHRPTDQGDAVSEMEPTLIVADFIAGEVGWGPTDLMFEQANDLLDALSEKGWSVVRRSPSRQATGAGQ